MKILVTSSRFPHALCEIRRFGEEGHEVYAADTFSAAPGSHSKYVVESFVTASPTFQTERFISDLEEIVISRGIDLIVPAFEEALYIAEHLPRLREHTQVFCSPLATLSRLHDKHAFAQLSRELGIPIPETIAVHCVNTLRHALRSFRQYLARPVYSRGGCALLTNAGPLAGRLSIDECQPTSMQPWIVQEFLHGTEVCSFSVAHEGRITAHCTYEHPKTIEHAGGILFESVDEPEALRLAQRYVAALDYTGQISFDYIRTDRGLVMLECNPRPTAGVFMMSSRDLCDAMFNPGSGPPRVVPPGVRRQIGVAIVRDMFRNWREIPNDLEVLLSGIDDVYAERGDTVPALYSLLSYMHVLAFRRRMNIARSSPTDLIAAQFFDVLWNGERRGLAA